MLDISIILAYLFLILWIGIKSGRNIKNITEFAIGKRNFSLVMLVATLSATLIGGGATLGLAEKTFSTGIIFFVAYLGICIERFLTAILVSKHIEKFFGLITAGDIMEKIYGKPAKIITGIATLTTSIFIIGAHITTMGFLLQTLVEIPPTTSLIIGTLIVLIYSGYGGIAAVSITDFVQFIFMLATIPLICALGLTDIGGFSVLKETLPPSHLNPLLLDGDKIFNHVIIFLSYSIPALYPVLIQRMLMAKNTKQIRQTLVINGILSAFFFALITLIGLIVYVKNPNINPQMTLPYIIKELIPNGLRGLVVVGLLSAVMSTVDSFLNLVGVSFTNDVLQPVLRNSLSEKRKLNIARFTTVFIGLSGLISALHFNGILENVFASMNIWIPLVFPALFLGITTERRKSLFSFYGGIVAGSSVSLLLNINSTLNSFWILVISATANFITIIILNKNELTSYQKRKSLMETIRFLLLICKNNFEKSLLIIDRTTHNAVSQFEIFGLFAILLTIVPLLVFSGAGNAISLVSVSFGWSIAFFSIFFIFKDLWIKQKIERYGLKIWPVFMAFILLVEPLINVISLKLMPLTLMDLLLGILTVVIITEEKAAIRLLILAIMLTLPFWFLGYEFIFEYNNPNLISTTIRFLSLGYFFITSRQKNSETITRYNKMSGTMAHEISHSIVSMKFCAQRLQQTISALIENYKTNSNPNEDAKKIDNIHLNALEELVKRLDENAKRTKNTMQIIQMKIGNVAVELDKIKQISINKTIHEAIKSGSIEILKEKTKITLVGNDFIVKCQDGALVHVFINLIKNSLEALKEQTKPQVIIELDDINNLVRITDNGCGISKKHLKNIFSDEFTTKKDGKGKGLYFCKMVLEEIGGSLSCTSSKKGTQFTLNFAKNLSMEFENDTSYESQNYSLAYR